jgi:hypothetical protein
MIYLYIKKEIMRNIVKLTERDLSRIIKKIVSEEQKFEFYDEMETYKSQKLAEKFIKDIKIELERPYMGRRKSFDEKVKMVKPTLEEIISAVKRVINDYENM